MVDSLGRGILAPLRFVTDRLRLILRLVTFPFIVLCFAGAVQAQSGPPRIPPTSENIDPPRPRSDDKTPVLGTIDEEMRAKQNLKLLEKEYKDNVARAREAATLSVELRDSLKAGRAFGRDEAKKLERLEKLAKKIRDEAGGSDEESLLNNPPGKLESALTRIADVAESLYKTLQKTPRQVISASIIENANVLLKLAKLTKGLFN
ncbi:MAG TPA: hypothetical protein VN643_02045 [Pyrinomonadaceae bacterium]|nr:hypothetical protein [Pyrinomonadaceae bacterium]